MTSRIPILGVGDKLDPDHIPAIGVRAYRGAAQSIPNTTLTAIDFDAESFDTHGFRDPVTNRHRFTIPAGLGGLYAAIGAIRYLGNSTGTRTAGIAINGSTYSGGSDIAINNNGTTPTGVIVATGLYLVPGDYVSLHGYQSSTAALGIDVSGSNTWNSLFLYRIGA